MLRRKAFRWPHPEWGGFRFLDAANRKLSGAYGVFDAMIGYVAWLAACPEVAST